MTLAALNARIILMQKMSPARCIAVHMLALTSSCTTLPSTRSTSQYIHNYPVPTCLLMRKVEPQIYSKAHGPPSIIWRVFQLPGQTGESRTTSRRCRANCVITHGDTYNFTMLLFSCNALPFQHLRLLISRLSDTRYNRRGRWVCVGIHCTCY